MPQIPLGFDKGLVTVRDPLRLQVGELTICRGAYYKPDDPDQLWKLPGRVSCGPITPTTEGDFIGLAFNSFSDTRNMLIASVDNQLYHTFPATPPYTWGIKSVTIPIVEGDDSRTIITSGGPNNPAGIFRYQIEMITDSTYIWRTNSDSAGTSWNTDSTQWLTVSAETPIVDTQPFELQNGVYIQFTHTSGYGVGQKFTFFAYGSNYWAHKDPTQLKLINDGYGRVVIIHGGNQYPSILDSDGNIRRFGMQQCQHILKLDSLVGVSGFSLIRPDSHTEVYTGNEFTDQAYAYDADSETRAYARMGDDGTNSLTRAANNFHFSSATNVQNKILYVDLRMATSIDSGKNRRKIMRGRSSNIHVPPGTRTYGMRYSDSTVLARMRPYVQVEVSTDVGVTWTTIFEATEEFERQKIEFEITPNISADKIIVRVYTSRVQVAKFTNKSNMVDTRIYDIFIAETPNQVAVNADWVDGFDQFGNVGQDGIADSGGILGGADGVPNTKAQLEYAVTEVYKTTLSDGRQLEVESLPSNDVLAVTFPGGDDDPNGGTDIYAVNISLEPTISTFANSTFNGYDGGNLFLRIYRTVLTSTPPYMAQVSKDIKLIEAINSANNGKIIFQDTFEISPDTLSTDPLPTYSIFGSPKLLAVPPPKLLDACLFRGAIVGIPTEAPETFVWSLPGFPEYFPEDQALQPTPSEGGDRMRAIATTGESLLLFYRRRVMRVRELFFVYDDPINLSQSSVTVLSPSEGLAGGPQAVCQFVTQFGRSIVAWVSDSGIWYTDAALVYERGVGVYKLSSNIDWGSTVDTTRLEETKLFYDPVTQIMWFDYFNPAGEREALAFHVSRTHWLQNRGTGEELLPKITGPHNIKALDRCVGEINGQLIHWLAAEYPPYYSLFSEGETSTDEAHFYDSGGNIETLIRTGWMYLAGPAGKFTAFKANLFHTDWGQQNLNVLAEFREDKRGIIQRLAKSAVSLIGHRITRFWLGRAGHSLRLSLRHLGRVVGAIGPIILTIEGTEED